MYKASCAGFTTLLRLASTLRSAQLPRIRANVFQKASPHKVVLHSIPCNPICKTTLPVHPSYPCTKHLAPDSPRSFDWHQPCARSTPAHPRERPSKTIAAQNRSPFDFTQAQRCSSIPRKSPSAGFTAFLCIASNPTKPIQRPTIRTCSAARAGDYGQPERRRTKKPPHPIGCGG